MSHKVRKSSSTRKKILAATMGATALSNSALAMFGTESAHAQTQTWIRLCIRNQGFRANANNSDVYVMNASAATPATTGCNNNYIFIYYVLGLIYENDFRISRCERRN